jgi:ketosteroid isomerase-like protein
VSNGAQEDAHDAIRRSLKDISAAWLNGQPERLGAYFHEDMVIVAPRFQERVAGRAACVASYAEFVGAAVIHDYHETEPDVHVVGDTAVATYRFSIAYSIDTTDFEEAGWDLFVFARSGDAWQAVWRTIVPAQ